MRRFYSLLLMVLCCAGLFAKTKKAVYIIIDGVPADQIERLHTPAIFDIASRGAYGRAYTGGEIGGYSQTATISAIGYTNLLTSTWFNKHNVGGNSDLKPNYNYWTIFRIAKEQPKEYKTAIYSSWTDNRTVLIGEGKKETNNLNIDYVKDGYDLDTIRFPKKEKDLHIFDIDEQISKDAAEGIRKEAPDLSWVYLWYTDDAGHIAGNPTIRLPVSGKPSSTAKQTLMKNGWLLLPPITDAEKMVTVTGGSPGANVLPGFRPISL